jgi:hypothetical protein
MGRGWGGEVSLQVTWGQGGQDRIMPKEGFQVSKREMEGKQQGISKGSKTRGFHYNLCANLYMCI